MWKILGTVTRVAAAVGITAAAPATLINNAAAAVAKHAAKKMPNQAIPIANLVVSTGISYVKHSLSTGDWAASLAPALKDGVMLAGGSSLVHQSVKHPIKARTGISI